MECAAPWLVAKGVKEEVSGALHGAYDEVDENEVPRKANMIDSYFICKVKIEEGNKML